MRVEVTFDNGQVVVFDGPDILLMVRDYGRQFRTGSRTRIYGSGVWEHVTVEQMHDVLDRLADV